MVLGYGSRQPQNIELSPLNREGQINSDIKFGDLIDHVPNEQRPQQDSTSMLRRIPSLSDLSEANSKQDKSRMIDNKKVQRLEEQFCIPATNYMVDCDVDE